MTGITDLHNELPSSSQAGQGPGRLLRQAREKTKLSLDDLSAQIKLARPTLDALERDDFAHLNEPVYVRGYYRKLSKVLPVLEADLIAAYDRVAGHRAPPSPSKLILAGGADLGSGRRVSVTTAISIVLLGLLIGAMAFWGKNRSAEPPAAPVVTAPSTPVTPAPESTQGQPQLEPGPVTPVAPEVAPEPVTATPAPAIAAPSATATTTSPIVTPPPAPQAASVTPSSSGALQIKFNGTSWAEVKDATGKVLISGLVEAGNTQGLDGLPPFVVFLGNAPGVTITYKGQPFDTTPFRRGDNTARITLP